MRKVPKTGLHNFFKKFVKI